MQKLHRNVDEAENDYQVCVDLLRLTCRTVTSDRMHVVTILIAGNALRPKGRSHRA